MLLEAGIKQFSGTEKVALKSCLKYIVVSLMSFHKFYIEAVWAIANANLSDILLQAFICGLSVKFCSNFAQQ